ncbi:hypothetical protein HZH66_011863 [Vespula vulgaris]|uniref:Uncharacterized protein n=2 Tax=Vespula TaxID=7451 RepID=A0A834KNU7_VESPE|nr:hypothetical protein HZH66_011863 [Vespula vulgaris]KAF7409196.1 hypothetical protein H0235_014048 [Vespula pensylvanica]
MSSSLVVQIEACKTSWAHRIGGLGKQAAKGQTVPSSVHKGTRESSLLASLLSISRQTLKAFEDTHNA